MPKKITDVSKKIIDAAVQIYREEGLERISMRRVAKLSGLAVGTVYNRFEDKEALLAQVMAGDLERLKNTIMERVFGKQPEEALYALTYAFIERMMAESNNIIKFVADLRSQRMYIRKILQGACRQINELVQEIIEHVYQQREAALTPLQSALICELALAMMQSASQFGQGSCAERTDIVFGMLVSYPTVLQAEKESAGADARR